MNTFWYSSTGGKGISSFFVTMQDDWRCSIGAIPSIPTDPRRELGTVTYQELQFGRDFPLVNGSLLRVQLVGGQVALTWDGQSLPQIPTPTSELVDKKTLSKANMAMGAPGAVGCLTLMEAWLSTSANVSPLQTAILVVLGFVFLVLTYFIARYSVAALIAATILYSIDTVTLLIEELVNAMGTPTVRAIFIGLVSIHIVFLTWMIMGVGPRMKVREAVEKEKARFASRPKL